MEPLHPQSGDTAFDKAFPGRETHPHSVGITVLLPAHLSTVLEHMLHGLIRKINSRFEREATVPLLDEWYELSFWKQVARAVMNSPSYSGAEMISN